jgi:hypothetical protein
VSETQKRFVHCQPRDCCLFNKGGVYIGKPSGDSQAAVPDPVLQDLLAKLKTDKFSHLIVIVAGEGNLRQLEERFTYVTGRHWTAARILYDIVVGRTLAYKPLPRYSERLLESLRQLDKAFSFLSCKNRLRSSLRHVIRLLEIASGAAPQRNSPPSASAAPPLVLASEPPVKCEGSEEGLEIL